LRLEAHATIAARQRSLPTFTLIDFPSQLRPRLSFPGTDDLGAMGDHVLAIDQEMRRRLVIAGVPENRVVVTGSPAFDGLWEAESLSPGEGDATHVLFLSQPIAALHGSDGAVPTFLGYTEGMVLDAVARMIAPHGLELRVRPHPREDESMLTKLARELPGRVRVDRTGSLREAIGRAQWVVGMTSIALVEAALLGKTAISVQFDRRGEDPLWTNVSGLTVGVIDREGLAVAVAEALRTARAPRLARSNMEALGWAPGAAGRVLACLDAATSSAQHR
jgi:hypothetical protein